jgi:uncharacterized protein (DUF983 family)
MQQIMQGLLLFFSAIFRPPLWVDLVVTTIQQLDRLVSL